MSGDGARQIFLACGARLVEAVAAVPAGSWEAPGLGVWDVRGLVGHTSRALTTVRDYAVRPAPAVDCRTSAEYLAKGIAQADERMHAGVAQRGVEAGQGLGPDPEATVRAYLRETERALATTPDDAVITTAAGGMRLGTYLETRVVELTVHGLDLLDALGVGPELPADALELTAVCLARAGVGEGRGPRLIRVLTGRAGSTFSVL
jgi:uncharacterized protein (TIGR03083 family)